jgi:hypothetical protein
MKKTSEQEVPQALKGRVLARVHADDLKRIGGADAKQTSTAHNDVEITSDPTWALADHAV